MLCENSFYKSKRKQERPFCKSERKQKEDSVFHDKCPLIYWCAVSERFEQTTDMFDCKYRGDKNDRQ